MFSGALRVGGQIIVLRRRRAGVCIECYYRLKYFVSNTRNSLQIFKCKSRFNEIVVQRHQSECFSNSVTKFVFINV